MRRPALALTLAALLASAALAAPAAAQSDSFRDARGDVSVGSDIHRVALRYAKQVKIVVAHADLRRQPETGTGLRIWFDGDRGDKGPEHVFSGGTFDGTDYYLFKTSGPEGWAIADRAKPLPCPVRMRLDYRDDTATVTIAPRCVGAPDSLRIAVRTTAGDVVDWLGERRELTRRVARG